MDEEDDMSDIRVRQDEVWAFATAVFLMARGHVPRRPEGNTETFHHWVRPRVSRQLWRTTLAEVKRLSPEERGDVVRPFLGDFDA
jgi:hypothetical protein